MSTSYQAHHHQHQHINTSHQRSQSTHQLKDINTTNPQSSTHQHTTTPPHHQNQPTHQSIKTTASTSTNQDTSAISTQPAHISVCVLLLLKDEVDAFDPTFISFGQKRAPTLEFYFFFQRLIWVADAIPPLMNWQCLLTG
jgi:hypothetical protein